MDNIFCAVDIDYGLPRRIHITSVPKKVGNKNKSGWIACSLGDALFVKRLIPEDSGIYPDMSCDAEAYVKDICIELEILCKTAVLKHGESIYH